MSGNSPHWSLLLLYHPFCAWRMGKVRWQMRPKHHVAKLDFSLASVLISTCGVCIANTLPSHLGFSTCWRVVSWISWSAGGQLVWCLYSRFLHICAKMHYGGAPWKRFEFVCLDTGYGVLWCPVFKFHVELWFQPWLGQGTNCRMYHTFVDEDAMRWLKGVLDVQLLLPVGGMSCFSKSIIMFCVKVLQLKLILGVAIYGF